MKNKKPENSERTAEPRPVRTPYKYGGSLGWIMSIMDPETSSWKRANPLEQDSDAPDRRHASQPDDDQI
jgi:hypothetical protein